MAQTFLIYNLMLIFATGFAYLCSKSKDKLSSNIFMWLSFLSVSIPAVIRYGIGMDYFSYVDIFNQIKYNNFINTEYFYYLINKLVIYFEGEVQWVFAISSLLTYLILYKSVPKKYMGLYILFYILSGVYFSSYSLVRQVLSTVILLYSSRYIYESKKYKFLICIFIAFLFHKSAIIFTLFYFIRNLKINRYILIVTFIIFFITCNYTGIINYIFDTIVSRTDYAYYITSKYNKETVIGSGLGILFRCLLGIFILYKKEAILRLNYRYNYLINIYMVYLLSIPLSSNIHIFNRFGDIFMYYQVLMVVLLIKSFEKLAIRRIALIILSILYFVLFIKSIYANNIESEAGGLGISPYKTIFN